MAEREGFEPSVGYNPNGGLANHCIKPTMQPLGFSTYIFVQKEKNGARTSERDERSSLPASLQSYLLCPLKTPSLRFFGMIFVFNKNHNYASSPRLISILYLLSRKKSWIIVRHSGSIMPLMTSSV